jgi:sulfide:quinone oxidoreductase
MARRVVIAGGGIAGIEAALGLRELAPPGTELAIVAPTRELLHQSLNSAPLTMGGVSRHPLTEVAAELGAELVPDAVESVDPEARTVRLRENGELFYDALLVAVGARRVMSLDHAVLFGSSLDAPAVGDVLRLVGEGRASSVAVVVPPAAAWSLPAYEVGLRVADAGGRAVVVTPEGRPADAFGSASEAVAEALAAAGVEVVRGHAVDIEPGCVVLLDERRIHTDCVVALPWIRGPRLAGLPHDPDGFLPTDPWCKVDGVDDVYGAGDGTTFPIRQGGVACQQAAVAAGSIARRLGADLPAEPLKPVVRGALPTPEGTLWLEHDLSTGVARASREPLWDPPHRVAGVRLPAFLERLSRGS